MLTNKPEDMAREVAFQLTNLEWRELLARFAALPKPTSEIPINQWIDINVKAPLEQLKMKALLWVVDQCEKQKKDVVTSIRKIVCWKNPQDQAMDLEIEFEEPKARS